MPDQNNGQNVGKVIEIRGVVIDALFTYRLPEIYTALKIERPGGEGDLIAEVQQHLGDDRVRAVAMDATTVSRAASTWSTPGAPSTVPGGQADARSPLERARRPDRRRRAASPRTQSAGPDPPRPAGLRRAASRRWRSSRPASR